VETPCSRDTHGNEETKIESLLLSDSTLIIGLKIIDNCCFSFICDIEILEDSVLNLIAYGYGESHCACYCCFGIDYHLTTNAYGDGKEFEKVKAVMVNGDRRTLKRLKK